MFWQSMTTLCRNNNGSNQLWHNKFNPSVYKLMFLIFYQADNRWVKMLLNNNTWINFGNKCDNSEKKLKVSIQSLKFKKSLEVGL